MSISPRVIRHLSHLAPSVSLNRLATPQSTQPIANMSTTASTTPSVDIAIVSDSVCPWCFVGKRRLELALKQLAPNVNVTRHFEPFFLDPTAPIKSMNKLERYYQKFGGAARVDSIVSNMKATGKELGINFSYGGNTGNTMKSHRLITFASKHGKEDDVVNKLFSAYFEQERDITLDSTLVEVAGEAGLDSTAVAEYLKTSQDEEEIKQKVETNYQRGITGVPFFIVDNKYAISGAQTPDVFVSVFKKLGLPLKESCNEPEGSNAATAGSC